MYSIHNRDDLEKLKKLQESKSSLKTERLKEKLGKQDFRYDREEVFEPVTIKQAGATKTQKQCFKNNYKRYVILLKQEQGPLTSKPKGLYKQYKTKLEQYENRSKFY